MVEIEYTDVLSTKVLPRSYQEEGKTSGNMVVKINYGNAFKNARNSSYVTIDERNASQDSGYSFRKDKYKPSRSATSLQNSAHKQSVHD